MQLSNKVFLRARARERKRTRRRNFFGFRAFSLSDTSFGCVYVHEQVHVHTTRNFTHSKIR